MPRRVFVTGATGFLGYRVVRALLDEEAEVTALVRPGSEDKLGVLRNRVAVVAGDVWNPASLKGRGRGHQVVIHLVGGARPDPKRGITFRYLNYDSARNVAQMAVGDGIPHFILLSAAGALPGVQGGYLENKRDAEEYLRKTGLAWTILRAPPMYAPGQRRNPVYVLIAALRWFPPLNFILSSLAPMSAEVAARGIARLAMDADTLHNRLISPGRLRAIGRAAGQKTVFIAAPAQPDSPDALDEAPFGWLP